MGCTYSSLSFSNTLELLKANNVRIVSTQQIDACKHIYTAHMIYDLHHFQLTYVSGKLVLSHRTKGRAKFLTIRKVIEAMQRVVLGNEFLDTIKPEERFSIYVDIWKDEVPDRCELRLNFGEVPVPVRETMIQTIDKVLRIYGYKVGSLTRSEQAIIVLPKHKVAAIKRTFVTLASNPIYEWRDYT